MLTDRYGLELSTTSVEARDAYVEAADKVLSANGGVETSLATALEADAEFALAHAAVARQHQKIGRPREARAAAEVASELVVHATRREQQHVEILSRMVNGKVPEALKLTHEHAAEYPRDALALAPSCGVFGSIGFSGRVDRERELLALLDSVATHYDDDWWFQTVHAFALTETGDWVEGRALAERSLAQFRANPNAAHTLAHALYEAGADAAALEFLIGWMPELDRDSLLHCHLSWHFALAVMTDGDLERARQIVLGECFPGVTSGPAINAFSDSVSFFWRSELAGAPRDIETWNRLSEARGEFFRRPIVFVDAHVGLVNAALGETDKMQACIAELSELGEAGRLPAGTTAAELTRAYDAFGREAWGEAIDLLEPMMGEVVRIGGSRAQRDLVTNTLLAAYVNDGRGDEAAAFLAAVHDRQPSRPVAGLK